MNLEVPNIADGNATFYAAILTCVITMAGFFIQLSISKRQNKANKELEKLKIRIAENSQKLHFKFTKFHELQLEAILEVSKLMNLVNIDFQKLQNCLAHIVDTKEFFPIMEKPKQDELLREHADTLKDSLSTYKVSIDNMINKAHLITVLIDNNTLRKQIVSYVNANSNHYQFFSDIPEVYYLFSSNDYLGRGTSIYANFIEINNSLRVEVQNLLSFKETQIGP